MKMFRITVLVFLLLLPGVASAQKPKNDDLYKKAVEAVLGLYEQDSQESMRPLIEKSLVDLPPEKLKELAAITSKPETQATTAATKPAAAPATSVFMSGSAASYDAIMRKFWNANVRFDEALKTIEKNIQAKMSRQAYESYGKSEDLKLMFVIDNKSLTPPYEECKNRVESRITLPAGGKLDPNFFTYTFDQAAVEETVNSSYNRFRSLSSIFAKELGQLRNQPELRRNRDAFRKAVLGLTGNYQKRADEINTQLGDALENLRPSIGGGK